MSENKCGVVFTETPSGVEIDLIGMDNFDPNNATPSQQLLVAVLMWLKNDGGDGCDPFNELTELTFDIEEKG